jgi:hypothetical protein
MACPFCALGLHHFAKSSDVEHQFRQRSRCVHPDKLTTPDPECFQFKMLQGTKDLALLYNAARAMPFVCPGLPIPAPVPNVNPNVNLNPLLMPPVLAANQWPTGAQSSGDSPAQQVHPDPYLNPPVAAASRWPTAAQCSGNSPAQQLHPEDSNLPWTKMRWRWFGKCIVCEATATSDWGHGGGPRRLDGWSRNHNLCPLHL